MNDHVLSLPNSHTDTVLIWGFLTQVLSQGQVQPGQCAFYEECGKNPSIENPLIPPIVPCLSYTPARALKGEHYQKLKSVSCFYSLAAQPHRKNNRGNKAKENNYKTLDCECCTFTTVKAFSLSGNQPIKPLYFAGVPDVGPRREQDPGLLLH